MATKVKGITIELNADASGIEKALKETNKSLSETQKQLQSVNKSLKLDPNNLELVEQKQRLLAKATEETKSKLEALKNAQAQLASQNDGTAQMQAQYDALTREISETEQKLNGLNREQRDFNLEAAQAEAKSSALGQALTKVGNVSQEVADKMRGISMAAAGALAAIGALAVKAGEQADEWLTTAQQIGLSTDAIQKFEYASEGVDVEMSDLVGAITRMKGNLDSTSGVWEKIGVSVKDQKGDYRDIETIFYDVISALGNIENETERDVVAMELFGRKANQLAGIIDDGGAKLRELGQEAEKLGVIIPEAELEKLNDLDEQLGKIKSQFKAAFMQAAIPVAEALLPILQKLSNAIKTVAGILENMNPRVVQIVAIILVLVAAITPIALIINQITGAIQGLLWLMPLIVTGIQGIGTALSSLLANPVVLTIAAIVAALALLAFGIYEVVKHWDEIKMACNDAINGMKQSIDNGMNAMKKFGDKVKQAINEVKRALNTMKQGFQQVAQNMAMSIKGMINEFNAFIRKCYQFGQDVVNGLVSGIKSVVNRVINEFKQMAQSIKSIWDSLTNDARSAGSRAATEYASAYQQQQRFSNNILSNPFTSNRSTVSPSRTGATMETGQIYSALNALNSNIQKISTQPTNVNVTLSGSAKNIFDTVQVQNSQMVKATGYHALA